MKTPTHTPGPAMPFLEKVPQPIVTPPLMTLREYYAGLALQGFVCGDRSTFPACAKYAVELADALIAELEKQP